jgi:TRAP-type C4-dicarboxylate transport system substrate-binding protein
VWTINPDFYASLSEEEKSVVNYAARSAIVAGRGMARAIEASDRGLELLKKTMKVYTPTAAERQAFKEVSQPVVKKVIAEKYGSEGEEMMNAFLTAIEES